MNVIKRKLPLGAVGVVLVLVLAAVGIVAGNWTQTLTINGTVKTAKMDAKWSFQNPVCFDDDKEKPGTDVGLTQMSLDPATGKLSISVDNAFPSYGAECNVKLQNNSKIPLDLGIIDLKPGAGLDIQSCNVVPKASSTALMCNELTVDFSDGTGQIDPGQSANLVIRIDVLAAKSNTEYGFSAWACVEPFGSGQCAAGK